ncbi:hypothetical protein [Phenylobacterium sp.]|uniref:hypothetical protein n=1 Tax=Phenylobacterium sp. TaxID=1871053 RepID=UPI0025E97A9D|nr:hypothetical protein [Phenylobacterium sp.]
MSNPIKDVAKRVFSHASDEPKAEPTPESHLVMGETRHIEPTPEGQKHDHLAEREAHSEDRQEALLDEALEESFPGSDPISPKHIT